MPSLRQCPHNVSRQAAESALQDGDEGGFEFQNMLASEITASWLTGFSKLGGSASASDASDLQEKIEELEGKYGTQPPLPGARNEPSQARACTLGAALWPHD